MLACFFHVTDLDGPVTDVQLALLLQRFSALPTFETDANVTLPVTLRSQSRRPCNRAYPSPTKSTTHTGLLANTSDSLTKLHGRSRGRTAPSSAAGS